MMKIKPNNVYNH